MGHRSYMDKSLLHLIAITMFSGSIVFIEPAPYEILMLLTTFYAFYCQYYTYNKIHFLPVILMLLFVLLNLIAMMFSRDIGSGIKFLSVSLYLIVSWIGLTGIFMYYKQRVLPYIFKGYTIGAVITVLIGICSYLFGLFPEVFLKYGRIQGFFKDPNVFGPYLVPASLYTLWIFTQTGFKKIRGWLIFCGFIILTIGIILSFSRAAWGQYVLAMLFYFLFIKHGIWKRMKLILLLFVISIPLLTYFMLATDSFHMLQERTGIQQYDNYRFANQASAVNSILEHPIGTGPGQSESQLSISAHSLYVRILFENGVMGLFVFVCFYLISLGRSIYLQFKSDKGIQGYFVIISASLIGILFNSIFVDTLHWRHMWILLAIPYMEGMKRK